MKKLCGLDTAEKLSEQGIFRAARNSQSVADNLLPHNLGQELARRGNLAPLNALQMALPGVPILPLPDFSKLVVATSANYVENVYVPDCQLVTFVAFTTGIYFVSFGSRCVVPPIGLDDGVRRDQIVAPTGMMFYAKGNSSVSVGIVNSGDVVSVIGWKQIP